MPKCLYCYQELSQTDLDKPAGLKEFHERCSKKIFGKATPPNLPYTTKELESLAEQSILKQKTVTGVQPKLSLALNKENTGNQTRLTIVGVLGEYILKPQTPEYQNLPENENLIMRLAEASKLAVVPNSLIRLESGELAYITRRIDRVDGAKVHMEDMCQLTERQTEHKYKGSYEQIASAIQQYSNNPGLDIINFYEVVLFSFLVGNADMHLKNFSLIRKGKSEHYLSPAYDLVSTALVLKEDEELALTLNGKKSKIKRSDFIAAMTRANLQEKVINNVLDRVIKSTKKWNKIIDESFLNSEQNEALKEIVSARVKRIKTNQ